MQAFTIEGRRIDLAVDSGERAPGNLAWVDLLSPSRAEEQYVEQALGFSVPTREDMVEIEPSSRLYREKGVLHLTASIMAGFQAGDPHTMPVSFLLTGDRLVTVRYDDTKSFQAFIAHLDRQPELCRSAASTLIFLLDAIVERLADVMEEVAARIDRVSKSVFRKRTAERKRLTNQSLEDILLEVGGAQEVISKVRESLSSLSRLISFLSFSLADYDKQEGPHLKTVGRDVNSLTDQAAFMSSNLTFLLDAALGLINIEQNAIIKIFSVAAVIFLPPTLVGTVYGMNFEHMPELGWLLGYPLALLLMVISAVLPYYWFKRKGWL